MGSVPTSSGDTSRNREHIPVSGLDGGSRGNLAAESRTACEPAFPAPPSGRPGATLPDPNSRISWVAGKALEPGSMSAL